MKRFDIIRHKKIGDYVFITRLLFFLLVGILLIRVYQPKEEYYLSIYQNIAFIAIPVTFALIITIIQRKRILKDQGILNYGINIIYLIITSYLLIYEEESFFKFLLLMPVMVTALHYGPQKGFIWAILTTISAVTIALLKKTTQMDVEILLFGIIWLFAWLLGKMSKTETDIREELQRQAALDGLTGVYNHRSFYFFLDEYFDKAKKENKDLTLIMIDVDFFKYYNDAYGHQKGDLVLIKIAKVIEEAVMGIGICARYGGDEFSVLLNDIDGRSGIEVGETIKNKVEEMDFEGANILPKGRLTISVGIASYPDNANNKEQLLQRADEALYKAKYTNTSRVELYYSVFDEIQHSLQDREKDLLNSMRTLLMVVNAKDRYTYGHSERVMNYAVQIGRRMAMWEWEIQDLTVGALLHDIGKIEVPREILNKPGKLTKQEWESVKHHTIWGADMIRPISSLSGAVEIVLHHHENYDGSGYPNGLQRNQIPMGARILRLADSFDAMTSNRPYKHTLTFKEAVEDIRNYCGVYYDPEVFEAFLEYITETGVLNDAG